MELVTARGGPVSTAGPPTPTAGTCLTPLSGTMGLIRLNGTRQWSCCPALCQGAKRGLSHWSRQGPERLRCPQVPVLQGGKGRHSWQHSVGRVGLFFFALCIFSIPGVLGGGRVSGDVFYGGARGQVRRAAEPRDRPLHLSGPGRRRPQQAVTQGDTGCLASRPRRAQVVPLRAVIRTQRRP